MVHIGSRNPLPLRALLAAVFSVLACVTAAQAQSNGDTAGSPIPAGVFLDGEWVPCMHARAVNAGFSCAFYGMLTQDTPVAGRSGFVWHHNGIGWQQRAAVPVTPPATPAQPQPATNECGGLSLTWIDDVGLQWSDGRRFNPYALTDDERCAFDAYQRKIPPANLSVMTLEVGASYTDIYQTESFFVLARITPVDESGKTVVKYVIQWRVGPRHATAAIDLYDPPLQGIVTRVDYPQS